MNTSDLVKVMKSHRDLLRVELSSKVDLREVWENILYAVYQDIKENPLDEKVRDSMRNFAESDDLSLVNKQGKLLKRFAKFFKESNGFKLDDSTMGIIGDKIQYAVNNKAREFFVDFTDSINWRDGQFGKSGSCWFGTYADSVPAFEKAGGWGIRFYHDENQDDSNGIGRTWIFPKDGMLMCFNSYGVERPQVSKVIKEVYKTHGITLHYKAVELYNSNDDTIPYINSGTGFILAPENIDVSTLDDKYDVNIEWEDEKRRCEGCNRRLDEDEENFANDYIWCDDCLNDRFSYCDKCSEYCDCDDVHEVTGSNRYSYMCSHCAQLAGFYLCEECGTYSEDYIETEDSETFCTDCADSKCYFCESCDVYSTEQHEHEEDEDSEEESEDEETQENNGENFESEFDFISCELEKIQYKNGYGTNELTTMVYRHENVRGMILFQNNGLYTVTHESSGIGAWNTIKTLPIAIEFLNRLQGLTQWDSISAEDIQNNRELCSTVLQIRYELDSN